MGYLIKLSEIKCSLFRPVKIEGKTRCRFFELQGDFPCCNAEGMFDCIIYPKKEKTHHSYSSISTFHECRAKYHYIYNLGIYPREEPDWKIRGRLFHEYLARYYRSGMIPELSYRNTIEMVSSTMAREYIEFYKEPHGSYYVEHEIRTDNLVSYIDLYDGTTVIDHKFSTNQPSFLDIAYQGAFYLMIMESASLEVEKFVIDFIKVPQMKQKGSESLEELSRRITKDVKDNPGKYFNRTYYNHSEFRKFIPMIKKTIEEIESLESSEDFYMQHKFSVMECEYETICITGQIDEKLYKIAKRLKKEE